MEDPWRNLHTRVPEGPFKGLYTTEVKGEFIRTLASAIKQHEERGTRILFYPHCPACYLFSTMRPATPNLWGTCPETAMSYCTDYLKLPASPRIVAHIKRLPRWSQGALSYEDDSGSTFATLAKQDHHAVVQSSDFIVYEMNK